MKNVELTNGKLILSKHFKIFVQKRGNVKYLVTCISHITVFPATHLRKVKQKVYLFSNQAMKTSVST